MVISPDGTIETLSGDVIRMIGELSAGVDGIMVGVKTGMEVEIVDDGVDAIDVEGVLAGSVAEVSGEGEGVDAVG
jgi:hypothetical protein